MGLTRIEDVAIGCGVSIVVGLLFWPRGAMAALGRALSDAFVASSGYLADAVDRLTSTSRRVDTTPGQRASHSAYLRLDDAFRQFLTERGAKVIPVENVANLFTGSNRIRLAAYTSPPCRRSRSSRAGRARIGVDRRSGPARFVRLEPPLVPGVRRIAGRPALHRSTHPHRTMRPSTPRLRTAFDDARAGRRGDRLRAFCRCCGPTSS